jgi:hypothetical protein
MSFFPLFIEEEYNRKISKTTTLLSNGGRGWFFAVSTVSQGWLWAVFLLLRVYMVVVGG